jgi:hypothetical protein
VHLFAEEKDKTAREPVSQKPYSTLSAIQDAALFTVDRPEGGRPEQGPSTLGRKRKDPPTSGRRMGKARREAGVYCTMCSKKGHTRDVCFQNPNYDPNSKKVSGSGGGENPKGGSKDRGGGKPWKKKDPRKDRDGKKEK